MVILLNIHLQASTLTFSTITSTAKLASLKIISFRVFHKVQIVANQIKPNPTHTNIAILAYLLWFL